MPRAVGLEVLACPAAGYASSPRSPTRGAERLVAHLARFRGPPVGSGAPERSPNFVL